MSEYMLFSEKADHRRNRRYLLHNGTAPPLRPSPPYRVNTLKHWDLMQLDGYWSNLAISLVALHHSAFRMVRLFVTPPKSWVLRPGRPWSLGQTRPRLPPF